MPKVSVVMPVYNTNEDELRVAIESILNQSYSDFEFVILNDASTNGVEDVILSYQDKRIRYLKNEKNLELIATSNRLIEEAKGEYIARLDSDDWCEPDRLEKQVKYLDENPEVGVLGSFYKLMPENRVPVIPYKPDETTLFLRYCKDCISSSAVMLRKSILDDNNLCYDTNCICAEDYKLWSDMSDYCKIANIPEVLSYYRNSPDGISANNKALQLKICRVIIFDKLIKDFAADQKYLYTVLGKLLRHIPITKEERDYTQRFLSGIANVIYKKLPSPLNIIGSDNIITILGELESK